MIVTCKLVEYPRLGNKILKENPIVLREKIKITTNQMSDFNASHDNMEYIEIVEEVKKTRVSKKEATNTTTEDETQSNQ